MWNGKNKAVTFSFDDGTTQDKRLIEIFDKYNLKATFNINSALLGGKGTLERNGRQVSFDKINPNEVKSLYENHEVAVHALTHPDLRKLSDEEIFREVEGDRKRLSELCGYDVVGMAYPFGFFDDRVVQIIRNYTGIKYSRTVLSSYNFSKQTSLLEFKPTVYFIEGCLEEIVERFLESEANEPQLLYIWGHSFELDAQYISWEKFEKICNRLSGRSDIFYGTNKEVLL